MTNIPRIIDLACIVEPHLDGGKLVSYSSRYLTKAGDNYGSCMLALVAKVEKQNGEIQEIPLVAKLPPLQNEIFWAIFQPERTCRAENAVYTYLSPAIRALQLEQGIEESQLFECFPKAYGSRISLNPDAEKVDRDAVLVQENLQVSGFKAGTRTESFDLAHCKLIMKELAYYHALPIALRLTKPEEFNKNIRPHFGRFNINGSMPPEGRLQFEGDLYAQVAAATNNNSNYVERAKELMEAYDSFLGQPNREDGLYTSIVHFDMWINNIMVKYDDSGRPEKLKFVDFQIAQYESVVHDLIFFLFSSVQNDVLENHMDELLELYYQSFIKCLRSLNISTDQYSFVGFMKEVHKCAPLEIHHALFMTKIILADHSTLPKDFKDMNFDLFSANVATKMVSSKTADIIRFAEKYGFWNKD